VIEGNVVVLPALLVGATYVVLARRAELAPSTIWVGLAAVAHIAAVVALTLFPLPVQREVIQDGRALQLASNNFIPVMNTVDAIAGSIAAGRPSSVLQQTLGNIAALAPLGVYGPFLWPRLRRWQATLMAGIGASLAVEAAQLLISTALGYTYRIADVDDVIFNAAGVMLGYAVYRLLARRRTGPGYLPR